MFCLCGYELFVLMCVFVTNSVVGVSLCYVVFLRIVVISVDVLVLVFFVCIVIVCFLFVLLVVFAVYYY